MIQGEKNLQKFFGHFFSHNVHGEWDRTVGIRRLFQMP